LVLSSRFKLNRFLSELKEVEEGKELAKTQEELFILLDSLDRDQLNNIIAALTFNIRNSVTHENIFNAIRELKTN